MEGGITARALGYSIHTEAETWDELREAIRDATNCHLEPADAPSMIRLCFPGEELVAR